MRVLAIGDVFVDCGCAALLKQLPKLKREYGADAAIVNGENSFSDGKGISKDSAALIFAAGADVITGGNHSLRRTDIHSLLDENPFLLRPDNIECEYGSGYCLLDMGKESLAVINLQGQINIENPKASNPFVAADLLIDKAKGDGAKYIFVDFHAETTSEKRALGFYLDGRVTAVFGTHTHVLTADAQVLPNGTGYITDIGMTGVKQSVLGVKKEIIIERLRIGDFSKFEAAKGDALLCGCLFETDDKTHLCKSVKSFTIE